MDPLLIGSLVFLVTYALIVVEKIHKTVVALLGGLAMVLLKLLEQHEAFAAIDFNVIFLLAGMMIIAHILRKTGIFQWTAIKAAKVARGDPFGILALLIVITAALSALLDNVTTVVLLVPLTLFIASTLKLDPVPFLISQVLASNIGGIATLIGDPPNILIGSAADLDFVAFLLNLTPIAVILTLLLVLLAYPLFRHRLRTRPEWVQELLALDEEQFLEDRALLRKAGFVLGLTLLGFLLHGPLGYEVATVALLGAAVLMAVAQEPPHEVFREIEWPTLFFFIGLFMVVEGVVKVGLIELIARGVLQVTQGNLPLTALAILWLSGILSGVVDNIPYTATMLPLVKELGGYMEVEPLWWALALGAGLGGNATSIGAAANVLVVHLAERSGHTISFGHFFRYGAPLTLATLVVASLYLWLRYLM